MTLNRGKEADLEKGLDPNDMESDGIGKKSEDASNSNKCEGTAQPARESPPQESEHPGTASRNKHPVNLRRDPCTTPSGSSAKPVEDTAPLERQEEKTAIDLIPNNRGAVAALVGRFPRHSRSRLLDGDGAIGHLHRINVVNARLALYKDYIRICGGRETGSWDEDVRILQENISRYSKSIAEYKAFSAAVNKKIWDTLADSRDEDIIVLADQAAKIDQAKGMLRTEDILPRDLIDRTEESLLKNYYSAVVFHGHGKPGKPPRATLTLASETQKAKEARKREEEAREKEERAWEREEARKRNREKRRKRMVKQIEDRKHIVSRIKMALFGGFALIVPMLIMVLHPTQLTALLTASMFVVVVAMILAISMKEAAPQEVVTATAAYAAVLVVFVGAYGSNVQGTTRSHGHSIPGGVIAGIVVGCIFGVGVLIVLIACCILRGCFASILDLFGMGRRRLKRIDDVNFVERVPRRGFLGLGGRGRSHRSFDSVDSDSYDTSTGSDSSNSIRTTNSRSRATKETRIREIPPAAAEPVAANQKVA